MQFLTHQATVELFSHMVSVPLCHKNKKTVQLLDLLLFFPDKPQFPEPPLDGTLKTFTVEENSSILINLTAKANPSEITYKWTNPDKKEIPEAGSALPENRLVAMGGTLNVTSAQRTDKGKYKVKATNEEGSSKMKFRLDVQYGPK